MSVAVAWLEVALALGLPGRRGDHRRHAATLAAARRLDDSAPNAVPRPVRLPRWLVGAAAAAAVLGVGWWGGAALAVALAAAIGCGHLLTRDVVRRRAEQRQHAAFLAAVRMLEAELDAGAGPIAAEVLSADPHTRGLGIAWRIGQDAGSALAPVLGRVAGDLGARDDQRRAAAVALAGPRASAALLTVLPAFGIVMGAAMGAHPLSFLLGAPAGRVVACAGVVLDAVGVLWVRRIVARAAS